ncbi:unnamed protein product [Arctia plantaginis]|uniref:Uncharacterized protein n=1 Tax=Arctia plantaginis TaxID=874455 RepID=A0A8S1BPL3_ARCPL|nr:unnamed protein product [Arctia plantaginis]
MVGLVAECDLYIFGRKLSTRVRDLHPSKNASVQIARTVDKDVLNLSRKRREIARGHGCPKGKIWYYTRCITFKELEDDFIASTTKTDPSNTTTATVQDDNHIESMETDVDLSVVALTTSAMTTKMSNEPRDTATQQSANVLEPNLNILPLETVTTSKLSDAELNPIFTKFTTKVKPNLVLTDPRLIIKTSNKELRTIVWTQPASAMVVINVTTTMPSRVKQEPHLLEANQDLSETEATSAVSQSNFVSGSVVTQIKDMTDLNNVTKRVSSKKKSGRTTCTTKPDSVETKQNPTATKTPIVTDPNPVVSESTTGADDVTLSTTDVTSTPAVVDMNPTVTKIKEIVTRVTAAETSYVSAETNSASVPETTPLPTGTRFTEAESGSSATTVRSRRITIPYFLYIFIYALEALTWRCALILVGISVIVLICISVRKYKKFKKYDFEEESIKRKTKQIVTSNQ